MADDTNENTCYFLWFIYNPFLPFKRMRATFFYGYLNPTPWTVTLDRIDHEMNYWLFWFRLECDIPDQRYNDGAVRIEVNISIDGRMMEERVEENYLFTRSNWHTYRFQARVFARASLGPYRLAIQLGLTFTDWNIANREGNGRLDDVMLLSEDLQRLFTNHSFADLTLRSNEQFFRSYPVHSYIIQARWCKFFRFHPANQIGDNVVPLNISNNVLLEILSYVYSGNLNVGAGNWSEQSFKTELFQVMDHYKLHHLYKVFAKEDALQFRTTLKPVNINSRNFRLDDDDNKPLQDPAYEWHVNPGTDYYFHFKIQFFLGNPLAPWCLYTLQSGSEFRVYAEVNLEFKKEFISPSFNNDTFVPMHQYDYKIGAFESAESGRCSLPVNSDFRELLDKKCRGFGEIRIEHFIRCILWISNGSTVVEVWNGEDIRLRSNLERLHILSDHMRGILVNPDRNDDLHIACRAERPGIPNNYEIHSLHKAFFVTRVPNWRVILGNLPEGIEIPLRNDIPESSEAFRLILIYIYSGKVSPIPVRYLHDVHSFAQRGGLTGLRNLVAQMRGAEIAL